MKTNNLIHLGSRKNISPASILMLKSDINYTVIYLDDGSKILSSTTIGILEDRLEKHRFFRMNRSTIINLNHLKRFTVHPSKNKSHIENSHKNTNDIFLSRRRVAAFKASVNA